MSNSNCMTTRCFKSSIHPKEQVLDFASFRIQIRRHGKLTLPELAKVLFKTDWLQLLKTPTRCSVKGRNIVGTWRAWFGTHPIYYTPSGQAYHVTLFKSETKEFRKIKCSKEDRGKMRVKLKESLKNA